jgi:hypothetical protein
MPSLTDQLNKAYFWDTDISQLDAWSSKRLIIERIISFGNLQEIRLIKEFYGVDVIKSTLCDLNYMDPKTLNFTSILFHIPKIKFKCYTRKQLTSQPWNF